MFCNNKMHDADTAIGIMRPYPEPEQYGDRF